MIAVWRRGRGVVAVLVAALGMTQGPAACLSARDAVDPSQSAKATGELIERCTAEARAAYYVGGASVEAATRIYDNCIADGGAR